MERVDGAPGILHHEAVEGRKGRGPIPLHHVPVCDEDDMLLGEPFRGNIFPLLLEHLRWLVGVMDIQNPFKLRHPIFSPFGAVQELKPREGPLPESLGDIKRWSGIVRNLIVIGSFSG